MKELNNIHLQKKFRILLIGDSCLDEYYYGSCERLSPEAPVPILKINHWQVKLGMAANVKDNLESFGCDVDFMTGGKKSIKRRYIEEKSNQHIVRVDEDKISPPFNPELKSLELYQYDAIVISDYNKGYVTYDNVLALKELFRGPIFIDSKKSDLKQFEGCYVKINEHERKNSISTCSNLITTLGSKGARFQEEIFETEKVEVNDVCGAGDVFLAALTYFFLITNDIRESIKYANKFAGISVQHNGVYVLTTEDIKNVLKMN